MNDNEIKEYLAQPLVSIITPSFNQAKFIRQTIDSVLIQTYKNIEYIVVDGGSSDETIEILNSYGSKLKFISEKDNGQANAINKGLLLANGRIMGFLNSDDFLMPNAVQNIVDALHMATEMWVSGDYIVVDSQNKPIHKAVVAYKRFLRCFSSKTLLLLVDYIIQPSTYWKRELIEKIGLFDEELEFVMDYEFWLRAINISPVKIINKPLSCFRIHNQSKGGTRYIPQFAEEIAVLRKHKINRFMIILHRIHNKLITSIYKVIK